MKCILRGYSLINLGNMVNNSCFLQFYIFLINNVGVWLFIPVLTWNTNFFKLHKYECISLFDYFK